MLAGVVLAGGKSSRMGQNKSLLTLPDSQMSLLEHTENQLLKACANNIFISGSGLKQGIPDIVPHCGPLSGIHAVLTHIQKLHPSISEILVLPVDMPDLDPEDFKYLIKRGRENNCLCSFENCFLPLYIPISIKVIEYLTAVLTPQPDDPIKLGKDRQFSVKKMVDSLQGLQIPALNHSRLHNINTPVQWQQRCEEQPIIKA